MKNSSKAFGLSKKHRIYKGLLLLCDVAVFTLLYSFFFHFRMGSEIDYTSIQYLGVTAIVFSALYVVNAYGDDSPLEWGQFSLRAVLGVFAAFLFATVLVYLLGPKQFNNLLGRGVMPVTFVGFSVWVGFSRAIYPRLTSPVSLKRHWLFIGEQSEFEIVRRELAFSDGTVDLILNDYDNEEFEGFRVLGDLSYLRSIDQVPWSEVIVATRAFTSDYQVSSLMTLRQQGVRVVDLTSFYEEYRGKVPIYALDHSWFMRGEGFSLLSNQAGIRAKRIIDILLSLILFLAMVPVIACTAVVIATTSKGPVFYKQWRVGQNGRQFRIVKFRTMFEDAETQGAQWAQKDDPRVTAVGAFLRKTRIDELPQVVNVLKGDMSFIGPRPERPEFVEKLEREIPYYDFRHLVLPGITGWAQVMYPYGSTVEDAIQKLEYDLYYIKNYSLALDLYILIRTVKITLSRSGR